MGYFEKQKFLERMDIRGAHVDLIGSEIDYILDEMKCEKDKTSENYMHLAQRINDMLEALDRASDLVLKRFTYEITKEEWEETLFQNNKSQKRLIGFTTNEKT